MDKVFSSWKEIAAYLGKGVRTVQRWEAELELPVHRPSEQGIILAYESELQQWARRKAEGLNPPVTIRAEMPRTQQIHEVRERSRGLCRKASERIQALQSTLERSRQLGLRIHFERIPRKEEGPEQHTKSRSAPSAA